MLIHQAVHALYRRRVIHKINMVSNTRQYYCTYLSSKRNPPTLAS